MKLNDTINIVINPEELWKALAHGDEDHRLWLKEAIECFIADQPVPSPRGSGNKEKRIYELEEEVKQLKKILAYKTISDKYA
jgi:hypothetical protein